MIFNLFKAKKIDLVLVVCPSWGVTQPPVAISYLKGFLQKNGIRVKCLDLSLRFYSIFSKKYYWNLNYPEHFIILDKFNKEVLPFLEPLVEGWAKEIVELSPKVVGFSLFMSSVNSSVLLAKKIRQLDPKIVLVAGGAEVTRTKRVVVDNIKRVSPINLDIFDCFDLLIDGEGEETLTEIVSLIKSKKDFRSVKGEVFVVNKDRIICNEARSLIKNADDLATPDFSDFDLSEYDNCVLPLVTSRGCINRCTFCADSPLWKTYRCLSAEKTVKTIARLVKKYNFNKFEIVDSTLNGDIRRLEKICDLLIKSRFEISWSAKATLDKRMNKGLLAKLKKAGCRAISYGLESASPSVLKDMRKNIDIGEAKEVIRDTYEAGIQSNCFFIVGYPSETEQDFQMTLDFITENAKFISSFDQVTACHIEEDSYLGLNLDKYGIELKGDGWYMKDNTPRIRMERIERFKNIARELHKHYRCEVQA